MNSAALLAVAAAAAFFYPLLFGANADGVTPLDGGGGFVEVEVAEPSGVERESDLVRGGVPFARGAVEDVRQLGVLDETGSALPSQAKQTAWWDDGSVKWAVVSFRTNLPADERRTFRVVVHPRPQRPSAPGVRVVDLSEERGRVALDTGKLRATFNTQDFRLFDSVHVLGAGRAWRAVIAPAADSLYLAAIHQEMPRMGEHWYAPALDGEPVRYASAGPVEFSVEEHGPLSATLRFAGQFRKGGAPDGEMGGKFILRVKAFADSTELEIQHTFIYTGEPTRDFTRALGVRLRPAFRAEQGVFDGAETEERDLAPGQSLVAVQDSADVLTFDGEQIEARPTGAAGLHGEGLSVSASVKEFWRHFPKGMSLSHNALDIGLWPEEAGRMFDLRRTVGDHEPGINAPDRVSSAQGLAKTHDIRLSFGEPVPAGELRRQAMAFNRPLVPAASPQYMCATLVEGHVRPMDFERFPRIETYADLAWRWLAAAQDRFQWYGFADYGDFRTNYRRGDGVWLDTGRYGWRQAAGDIPAGLGLTYLRLGNLDLRELFVRYVEHIRDVDTVHYADGVSQTQPVGTMHRRGKDHWSGAATAHYTYVRGLALAYFLTGDPRTLEVLRATAHGDSADVNMVTSGSRAYEATGEQQYRDILKERIQRFIGSPPQQPYNNFRFASDYFRALAQYVRVVPDDEVALNTVVEQAAWWTHPDRWFRYNYGYGFYHLYPRSLAFRIRPEMRDKFITYSAYALYQQRYNGPTDGYQEAGFEELDELVSSHGVNLSASLTAGWYLDFYPYGVAAMADAGMAEEDVFDRSKYTPYIGRPGLHHTQTNPDGGPEGGFAFLRIPDPNWPGDKPLRVSDPDGRHRFEPGFERLPWGGRLTLAGVPFQFDSRERGFAVLGHEPISVPVGRAVERIHLLGNVGKSGNWNKGDLGATYRVVFADGTAEERPMRNLVDYEDVTMWKFSQDTALARYIGYGRPLPRAHLNIATLEAGGRHVESVQLLPGDVEDGFCLVAATAETAERHEPVEARRFSFGPETPEGAVNAGGGAYSPETGYGWSSRRRTDGAGADIGRGADFRVGGLEPGRYRITARLRTLRAGNGGLLDIIGGGRRLQGVAVANNADDEISFVGETEDGALRVGFYPNPLDMGGAWAVRQLQVAPTAAEPLAEAFDDPIADLRPLRSVSFDAEASCEQGWFDGYDFHHPRAAIDGRFGTAFGLPQGHREVQLVLTFPQPATADAVRLLVGNQIEEGLDQFDLRVEAEQDGEWRLLSDEPQRIERLDYVFRFAPATARRFRLNIGDRRPRVERQARLIREFQLFDTQAGEE